MAATVAVETVEIGSLKSKALTGSTWTVLSYGASQILRFGNSMVLTRLVLPEAFGLMALVTTFIVGMSLLSDIGLQPCVIQSSRGDDPRFLNTAWTIQAVRGIALWIISILIAWPLASFYREPRLLVLIPVLGVSSIITGFHSSNLLSMARHISVRRLFAIDFSTQIVQFVVTIGWALLYPSVWALVAGKLASDVYRLVVSHHRVLIPGIRNRLSWDPDSARSLVSFGRWIMLGTACFFFASQSDRLILGRLVSFSMLGVYGIAFSLSDIPRQVILAFCSKVGYPFVAKLVHLPFDEFRKTALHYRFYVLLAGAALIGLVTHLGGVGIHLLFDKRYHDAAWMIPILAVGLWHTLLYSTTKPIIYSLGKSHYDAIGNALYGLMIVITIPVGFHFFGMVGAVVAVAAGDLPLYVVTQVGASREGIRPWLQDAQATGVLLLILSGGLAIRHFLF